MALRSIGRNFLYAVASAVILTSSTVSAVTPTITRDSFGVPTINGGDFPGICRAIGQVYAEDRLWQMFEVNAIANGRAAQFISPLFLPSDVFQRQINPTDAEVQQQIDKYFTTNAITAYTNYVQGLNDQVAIVNANPSLLPFELFALGFNPPTIPVPEFTLYDILRTGRFFFQQFSESQIPQYQLSNLATLQTLTTRFDPVTAYAILNDLDPLSSMIESQTLIVPSHDCKGFNKKEQKNFVIPGGGTFGSTDPEFNQKADAARDIGKHIKKIKDYNKRFVPGMGSNGQAIGPKKSKSGNALLRMAPQPNMNFPSDLYEFRVISDVFTCDTFVPVATPFALGVFNHFGFAIQTGHLPTDDFLFESVDNVISSRQEAIFIQGNPDPVIITVYRSKSNGWVIQNPVPSLPGTMLTLRSGFFDRQLQGLNIVGELPFIHNVKQFIGKLKRPGLTSDILGFQGQTADSHGNIGAYQATHWIKLNRNVDRRLPQGIIVLNPRVSNEEYIEGRSLPQHDINTDQGFYSGWNTIFKREAQASGDTLAGGGPGLNRGYWLENAIKDQKKLSFDDLKNLTVVQAVANSILAFDPATGFGADLFTPLFKKKFLHVLKKQKHPTHRQKETLELLKDFQGNWLPGKTTAEIANTIDVSDRFILASAWLLNFAGKILNPFVVGTQFEVNTGSLGNPLPNTNVEGANNNLLNHGQGNLLARLLNTNCDNTVFYPGWLKGVHLEKAILDSLDEAIDKLGGFGARPWGAGRRPIYQFKDLILGTVATMRTFNASGLYMVAEFSRCGVKRLEAILPLGESGTVLVGPGPSPQFNPNNFDQLPLFTQFQLRTLPPFVRCSD